MGRGLFAQKLLDYECASNVELAMAAGGVDAAPILECSIQSRKLKSLIKTKATSKVGARIDSTHYVEPNKHKMARERVLRP